MNPLLVAKSAENPQFHVWKPRTYFFVNVANSVSCGRVTNVQLFYGYQKLILIKGEGYSITVQQRSVAAYSVLWQLTACHISSLSLVAVAWSTDLLVSIAAHSLD
jgi:hypothetical protein